MIHPPVFYTVSQVRHMTGVSRRQLDHWRALGLIWPAVPAIGRGHGAGFDDEDIRWIRAIVTAVEAGVDLTAIRVVSRGSRAGVSAMAARLRAAADLLETSAPSWLDERITSM